MKRFITSALCIGVVGALGVTGCSSAPPGDETSQTSAAAITESLTLLEAETYAKEAGISCAAVDPASGHHGLAVAGAVAEAESGLCTSAIGGGGMGLWQIQSGGSVIGSCSPNPDGMEVLCPSPAPNVTCPGGDWTNPAVNASWMATMSSGGTNWEPWCTYGNCCDTGCASPPYLRYIAAAESAYSTLCSAPPPRLDVFVGGVGGELYHRWYDGGWSAWEAQGGTAASAPAVASWAPGRLDLFVQGTDERLWHQWYANGWSAWEDMGGPVGGVIGSAPAAVSWASGRIDLFVRGTDAQLWHRWYANGWSGWEPLGGRLASAPAVASWAAGRLDVFVEGTDTQLWHKYYDNAWSAWEPLGGALGSAPAAVSWGAGRVDVFARGTDAQLWHRWYDNGWSVWEARGGVLTDAPAAASWGPGRLDVFARGVGDAMYHQWFQGAWSGWQSLDGYLTTAPAATSWTSTH